MYFKCHLKCFPFSLIDFPLPICPFLFSYNQSLLLISLSSQPGVFLSPSFSPPPPTLCCLLFLQRSTDIIYRCSSNPTIITNLFLSLFYAVSHTASSPKKMRGAHFSEILCKDTRNSGGNGVFIWGQFGLRVQMKGTVHFATNEGRSARMRLIARPALGVGKEWGLFTWNNHRLLNFKVSVLDPAAASGSVVI